MNYLNISITPSYVITLEYDKVADSFVFKSDINCVNGWKIKNIIKHDIAAQYVTSHYTSHHNFLEFVIKDLKGCQRKKKYFYNSYEQKNVEENTGVHCKQTLSATQAIAYFIENTKIFHYANWEEYDAGDTLEQISDIMKKDISKKEILQSIKELLIK